MLTEKNMKDSDFSFTNELKHSIIKDVLRIIKEGMIDV